MAANQVRARAAANDFPERWMVAGALGLVPFMVAAAVTTVFWRQYPLAPYAITQAAALLLFYAGWRYGHAASYRGRVACLVVVFIALVLQFAIVHAVLGARNPESFNVADTLLDSRVREELAADRRSILRNANLLFAATMLEADAPAVYAALTDTTPFRRMAGGFGIRTSSRTLSGGLAFRYTVEMTPVPDREGVASMRDEFSISSGDGQTVARFSSSAQPALALTPGELLARELLRADDAAAVARAARAFGHRIGVQQGRTVRHMHGIIRRDRQLDLSHYIYFSATVMTTIGTADLTPATSAARMLVTLQAFVAVFFLGFAINFLWPAHGAAGKEE